MTENLALYSRISYVEYTTGAGRVLAGLHAQAAWLSAALMDRLLRDAGPEDLQVLTHPVSPSPRGGMGRRPNVERPPSTPTVTGTATTGDGASPEAALAPIVAHLVLPTDPTRLPMLKERVQRLVVGLVVILLVARPLAICWFPRRCWVSSAWTATPG